MKNMKRLLFLLILGVLGWLGIPVGSRAAEMVTEQVVYVNPVYEGIISSETIASKEPGISIRSRAAVPYFETMQDAGAYLREGIKSRKEEVVFQIDMDDFNAQSHTISEYAFQVTSETPGDEGDYLKYNYGGWKAKGSHAVGSTLYTVTYTLTYYTTDEEEKEVGRAIASVLSYLNLSGKSDYEKIAAVYEYVCSNVTYDYGSYEEGDYHKYTTYNAVIKKKAVCQGYASLVYRLLRESGVTARVIAGVGASEAHAWNIAPIGGVYYNLDSTWDANYSRGSYRYFLQNQAEFVQHTRNTEFSTGAFLTEYPMAAESYHNWSEDGAAYKAATCEEPGEVIYGRCMDCGKVNSEELPRLGHNYSEWVETKEATCTEEGTETRSCQNAGCTKTETRKTSRLAHIYEAWTEEKAATCTQAGLRVPYCVLCGAKNSAGAQTIAPLGHSYGAWTVTKAAACTAAGEQKRTCSRCQETETQAVKALSHQAGEWKTVKAATCTTAGEQTKTCTVCGEILERAAIRQTGHTFLAWTQVKKATVLAEGQQKRTCTVCGYAETQKTAKEKPTLVLTAGNITMQAGKSTAAVKVKRCGAGDRVVSWTSSKPKVVTVNKKTGKLTAKKTGTAYITVKMKSGIQKRIRVKVQKAAVQTKKLTLNKTKLTLKKGRRFRLQVTRMPVTATDKITYISSNSKVAKVSSKGLITARKKGTAVITVKSAGGKKVRCRVTVK